MTHTSKPVDKRRDHSQHGTGLIDRAFAILNLVASRPGELGIADLQSLTGTSRSTLYRIVAALKDHGVVRVESGTRTYRLGFKLVEYSNNVLDDSELIDTARSELKRLADLSRGCAYLTVIERNRAIVVDRRYHEAARQAALTAAGDQLALDRTSAGYVLLAFSEKTARKRLMRGLGTERSKAGILTGLEPLRHTLEKVHTRGYAKQYDDDGQYSVAAPIVGSNNRLLAALALTIPKKEVLPGHLLGLGSTLAASGQRIARLIGASRASSIGRKRRLTQEPAARCVAPANATLGDSPQWCPVAQSIYWVDSLAPSLHRFTPKSGVDSVVALENLTGVVAVTPDGSLIVASGHDLIHQRFAERTTTNIVGHALLPARFRFTASAVDQSGRLWLSTIAAADASRESQLFTLDPDGVLTRVFAHFGRLVSLALSPDNRVLYAADSVHKAVTAYPLDPATGRLGNATVFADPPPEQGAPRGLAVDSEGGVWCTNWDGWSIARYDPTGQLDRTISVPVPRPSGLAFGGDALGKLYITTARISLSPALLADAPLSGGVFELPLDDQGIRGNPVHRYMARSPQTNVAPQTSSEAPG